MKDKLQRINNVKRINFMSKQSEYWPEHAIITKTGQSTRSSLRLVRSKHRFSLIEQSFQNKNNNKISK